MRNLLVTAVVWLITVTILSIAEIEPMGFDGIILFWVILNAKKEK